jgi:hypothetical protein
LPHPHRTDARREVPRSRSHTRARKALAATQRSGLLAPGRTSDGSACLTRPEKLPPLADEGDVVVFHFARQRAPPDELHRILDRSYDRIDYRAAARAGSPQLAANSNHFRRPMVFRFPPTDSAS